MGTASALHFAHTAASLTLQVIASGSDESWAIDNQCFQGAVTLRC